MEWITKADENQPAKAASVLFCRACLATEEQLFNLHEYKLVGEFFRVSGIIVTVKDELPQHLCMWCAAFMKRCAAFRAKCLRAEQCLQLLKGELTTESIRTIDRLTNRLADLNQTETECINIDSVVVPVNIGPMPVVNTDIDVPNIVCETVKKEIETDSLNIDNEVNVMEANCVTPKHEPECLNYFVIIKPKCEDTIGGPKANVKPVTKRKNNVKPISKTRKREAPKSTEVKIKIPRKKIENPVDNKKGEKRKRTCKKRTADNDFMPNNVNLEEFKETCNVDVFILTPEEQVAEIEARRATDEYKTAVFTCAPCGKYFRADGAYDHHKAKHEKEAGAHECPVCRLRFQRRTSQLSHYDRHRFKMVCKLCGFVSRARHQAKLHHEWHSGKRYQCKYCGNEYNKQSTYLTHVRQTHALQGVVCDMCGETFINAPGLRMHKVYMHGVAVQEKSKTMECATCSVTFVSLAALNKHKMAAGEHDKMAACAQCGDTYDTEDGLKGHVEAEHPRCQECDSTFLNSDSYELHIMRKHLGKREDRKQKRRAANERARALGLPKPYASPKGANKRRPRACCDHCGKMLPNTSMLRYHMQKHMGQKLAYCCAHCPRSFYIKAQLELHMRVHTGEKPYKCEQCNYASASKSNLSRHVLTAHLGIRGSFPCSMCGRSFTTKASMQVHVRAVHGGAGWPKRDRSKRKRAKDLDNK